MPSWTSEPSGTMAAAVLISPGSQPPHSCFTYRTDYPKPSLPSADWVLVRVRAAGLNRAELRGRNNEPGAIVEYPPIFRSEYHENPPNILGEEFVGEVEEAGSNTTFQTGDRVAGIYYGGGKAHDGSYAEYTIARKEYMFKLPSSAELSIAAEGNEGIKWSDLGAIAGTGWTAWGSLFESGATKDGDTVFVHGGTSSTGIWAILLAKAHGCTVIASTRQQHKVQKLKDCGADHVVLETDHEKMAGEINEAAPRGVNTVIELVDPNAVLSLDFKVMAPFATVVACGVLSKQWTVKDFPLVMIPHTRKVTMHAGPTFVENIPRALREMAMGIRDGKFGRHQYLDSTFSLAHVGKAHDRAEANEATGRIVLTM